MEFEVDVSGEDIFSSEYVICIAGNKDIIRGFKFDKKLTQTLRSRYGQGLYKYKKSNKQNSLFKIRIYTIVIYYLLKSIRDINEISLVICRDFYGKENDINANLKYLLESQLGLKIKSIIYNKLKDNSNAHKYAKLMRMDSKNIIRNYVQISLSDFEKYLKK